MFLIQLSMKYIHSQEQSRLYETVLEPVECDDSTRSIFPIITLTMHGVGN